MLQEIPYEAEYQTKEECIGRFWWGASHRPLFSPLFCFFTKIWKNRILAPPTSLKDQRPAIPWRILDPPLNWFIGKYPLPHNGKWDTKWTFQFISLCIYYLFLVILLSRLQLCGLRFFSEFQFIIRSAVNSFNLLPGAQNYIDQSFTPPRPAISPDENSQRLQIWVDQSLDQRAPPPPENENLADFGKRGELVCGD